LAKNKKDDVREEFEGSLLRLLRRAIVEDGVHKYFEGSLLRLLRRAIVEDGL